MIYPNIREGLFLSRPNRFIANVIIEGCEQQVHVKNTGRLKELLLPGRRVFLCESENPKRKTKYDLICVQTPQGIVNIDSLAPNKVAPELIRRLFPDIVLLKSEVTQGDSRFDFYAETIKDKIFIEVKGVTLSRGEVAYFPDAQTARGIKHINGLIECASRGYKALILMVIQKKGPKYFCPNEDISPAFKDALKQAAECGVMIKAADCIIDAAGIIPDEFIEVVLEPSLLIEQGVRCM